MENLMDGLFAEMNRVRGMVKDYEDPILNGAGKFAASLMKISINQAEKAIRDNNVIDMLRCYNDLKDYKN